MSQEKVVCGTDKDNCLSGCLAKVSLDMYILCSGLFILFPLPGEVSHPLLQQSWKEEETKMKHNSTLAFLRAYALGSKGEFLSSYVSTALSTT